ncbi:hypothetical protein [Variovorax sp. 278MFTsu5.1]|uniref:hypothetical protein n=1 Tax=Variovorax sp. 278MFTsu5.1 TaxID=3158366 RepID=UPI003AAB68B1
MLAKIFLRIFSVSVLTAAAIPLDARAQEIINPCRIENGTSDYPPNLQRYELGHFRIFYTTTGDHAVIDTADINANGVPDYVENLARQADFTHKALTFLGFRSPLESARYRAVKFIDIGVKDLGGYNGLSYDEPWRYPNIPLKTNDCTALIDIHRNLVGFPGNWAIVSHELFHLFGNSYTMFKASWVSEAASKWAEYIVRAGWSTGPSVTPLPSTMAQMETLVFPEHYPMEFWNRLLQFMDASPNNSVYLPAHLTSATYVDGTYIMKDSYWRGMAFFLAFYQALDAEDDIVSAVNGWGQYNWLESDQKNVAHNQRILKVLQRVVRRTGISDPEINAFLAIP